MSRLLFRASAGAFAAVALCLAPMSALASKNDQGFRLLEKVPIPANAAGCVAVNEVLNRFYTSGGANTGGDVYVFDGNSFAGTNAGSGSCANIDLKNDTYWAPTIYGGGVIVRNGRNNSVIATLSLGGCPINTTYDLRYNRMWVGAQCGGGNDPLFAIDAYTFHVIAGPIGTNGVMGPIIANSANGRLYFTESVGGSQSKRINPITFALTINAFGSVMAINTYTNMLYASTFSGNNLQIINGAPDPEVILNTIPLSYGPGSMGINQELNHLYVTNPVGNSVEVRDGQTGALINTFSLAAFGATPWGAMTVDSIRGRIYVTALTSKGRAILVIEDLTTARQSRSN
jgi:DNA-binding beta-propeller fold protein YncE